jgi:hypothetical protein
MTLKHRAEFSDDYHWKKTDTLNGCKAIILTAVNNLLLMEPFNASDGSTLEREALISFKQKFIVQLERLIPRHENIKSGSHDPKLLEYTHLRLSDEVDDLVSRLKEVELINKVRCVLMAVCGLILGILAAVPLGIPLCFSPVRNYIGSFFSSPKMSAQQFPTHMQTAMTQLNEVLRDEIECFADTDRHVFCFNNVSV